MESRTVLLDFLLEDSMCPWVVMAQWMTHAFGVRDTGLNPL